MISFKDHQYITEQVNFINKFHTLGMPRAQLPQIAAKDLPDFVEWLRTEGHTVKRVPMKVTDLKLTQGDIDLEKVIKMIHGNYLNTKPILISSDNYITDGHHRLLAMQIAKPKTKILGVQVDITIRDLINKANSWSKSFRAN